MSESVVPMGSGQATMTERSNEPASRTRFDVVYARHYDRDRAIRKVSRYLGPDIGDWDDRFGPDSVT